MKEPSEWPKVVEKPNAKVSIYRTQAVVNGKAYPQFKVVFYGTDGKRRFKTFAKYEEAHLHADTVCASLSSRDAAGAVLTGQQTMIYQRAVKALKDHQLTTPLDLAVTEYAHARVRLGNTPLAAAVAFYQKAHQNQVEKSVPDVVAEIVEKKSIRAKGGRPASEVYLKDMRSRLGAFAAKFHCPISSVTPKEVEGYLDSYEGRSRFNHARMIRTLFKYAAKRGYCQDAAMVGEEELETDNEGDIAVFTPAELERMLRCARPEMIPFLAIGAFAGVRHAELCRLDWSNIGPKYIEVTKDVAKRRSNTRARRLVPIHPALEAWIAPHRKPFGPVVEFTHVSKQIGWLVDDTAQEGLPPLVWKRNGLRHSCITYKYALTNDENLVAAESGNSPAMIHANYRALATKEEAERWFAIRPTGAPNIVPMAQPEAKEGAL